MRRALIFAVVALVLTAGSEARAAKIHSPANGALFKWGATVLFDWRWAAGEFQGTVYFGRTPVFSRMKLALDAWRPASNLTATLDSHSGFRPGRWYWAVCAQTYTGEDDKCYLATPIRGFTVLAPPKPKVYPSKWAIRTLGRAEQGSYLDVFVREITKGSAHKPVLCWEAANAAGQRCIAPDPLGSLNDYESAFQVWVSALNTTDGVLHLWVKYRGKKVASLDVDAVDAQGYPVVP